jgi:hypothetical protein
VLAQEGEPGDDPGQEGTEEAEAVQEGSAARLFITNADTSAVPAVVLRTYGFTPDGRPLSLNEEPVVVRHAGETIEETEVAGTSEVGTFTIFLIDVTPGVEAQIPAIQQAIEQFASDAYMKEQVDAIAIYRVGPEGAEIALEPTIFYNAVRNFFATPLQPQDGPTALIDSLVGLLNEGRALAPNANLVTSIVVFSDGTDAVSTQFQAEDVARTAREQSIPVHTVWLQNEELTVGQEAGRNYLAQVASDAYGVAARQDQPETVTAIFDRIIAFREQQLLRYIIPTVSGGPAPVEVNLLNDPTVQAQTEVTINASSPTVSLNVPPDSRTLQLPTLEDPVRIALSASAAWLDGTERSLQQAQLLVNDTPVQEVPVEQLERFEVEINNFIYGDNSVRLEVTDEQGLQATSPPIVLSVVEGETAIPEPLQASTSLLPSFGPVCLAGAVLLALFGLGGLLAYRAGRLPTFRRPGRRRREPAAVEENAAYPEPPAPAPASPEPVAAAPAAAPASSSSGAFLEVLATETQMPSRVPLQGDETRLGRSPSLADVAFEQDITVSRLHATILWDGHNYRLYDDDSTSGTWVNDQAVPDYGAQLFDGDDIYLGKVHLRFRQQGS